MLRTGMLFLMLAITYAFIIRVAILVDMDIGLAAALMAPFWLSLAFSSYWLYKHIKEVLHKK